MATPETATAVVRDMLAQYGLSFSANQVDEWVGLLSDDPNNMELIQQQIRESDEFAERFPGLQQRLDNGYNQISVAEYLELEDAYSTIMRTTGMPQSFYDSPEDFAEFFASDIDPTELESRVAQGFVAAQQAPDEVKAALQELYGIQNNTAALAAYYLDPDRALTAIQREFESAQIAGTATSTGFAELSRDQAERLQQLGISEAQARQGFSELGQQEGVLSSNLGSGTDFTVEEQMAAQFEQNADVQARIRRQREQRVARFQGGMAPTVTERGVAGLGGTDRTS